MGQTPRQQGDFRLFKVTGDANRADALTKHLPRGVLPRWRNWLDEQSRRRRRSCTCSLKRESCPTVRDDLVGAPNCLHTFSEHPSPLPSSCRNCHDASREVRSASRDDTNSCSSVLSSFDGHKLRNFSLRMEVVRASARGVVLILSTHTHFFACLP